MYYAQVYLRYHPNGDGPKALDPHEDIHGPSSFLVHR